MDVQGFYQIQGEEKRESGRERERIKWPSQPFRPIMLKIKTSQRSESMLSKRRFINRASRDSSTCASTRVAVILPSSCSLDEDRCVVITAVVRHMLSCCVLAHKDSVICLQWMLSIHSVSCKRGDISHSQWRVKESVPLQGFRALGVILPVSQGPPIPNYCVHRS